MTVDGWFIAALVIGVLSTVTCVGAAILKKKPNDITLLAVAAVWLFTLVYLVASIVRVATGSTIAGATWEFWAYLVTAVCIPIAGFYWAMLERSFWSNYVLGAVGVTVVVMMARMAQIWYGSGAPAAAALHGLTTIGFGA
ncbi:hypothetical protein [Specibacter cremeus]|uniref:hypothetical protein n=1 Tax=Specibacter cremeus TaxID=1629051 RepID=UPI000F7B4A6D|nr:hypothetical protein [Specibacter cremeus]